MKTKVLIWSVVSILTAGVASGASNEVAGNAPETSLAQSILLSDGTKLTLLGVTYGRHHVAPNFEAIGGNLESGNWIDTPANDTTVVWFETEHESGRWPSYQLLVSDKANTACVPAEVKAGSHVKNGVDVQGFLLQTYPRWDKEMIVRVLPYGSEVAKEHFVIANPQPGIFASAPPPPLPIAQSDGDFEVRLTKFAGGAESPFRRVHGVPANDIANKCVRLDFDFKQNGQAVTNWSPRLADTSDAAGNHVRGVINEYVQDGKVDGYFYQPGLWPDEPSWKVRLEFSRTSGFSDDEILTLTNIPVQAGTQKDSDDEWTWEPGQAKPTFSEYSVNGVHLKLFPPMLLADEYHAGQKHIRVVIKADPDPDRQGMRLTVLQATDDQNRDLGHFPIGGGYGNFSLEIMDAPAAKSINLKLALHKERFVEFNVKPATP